MVIRMRNPPAKIQIIFDKKFSWQTCSDECSSFNGEIFENYSALKEHIFKNKKTNTHTGQGVLANSRKISFEKSIRTICFGWFRLVRGLGYGARNSQTPFPMPWRWYVITHWDQISIWFFFSFVSFLFANNIFTLERCACVCWTQSSKMSRRRLFWLNWKFLKKEFHKSTLTHTHTHSVLRTVRPTHIDNYWHAHQAQLNFAATKSLKETQAKNLLISTY